jgi:hypothetical protein
LIHRRTRCSVKTRCWIFGGKRFFCSCRRDARVCPSHCWILRIFWEGYTGVAENYRQGIYGHRFVLTVTPFCSIRGFLVDCFFVSFCLLTPLDGGLTMLRAFLSLGWCNGDMRAPLGLIVGVPFVSNQHIHFAVFTHLAGTFGLLLHVFGLGGIHLYFF